MRLQEEVTAPFSNCGAGDDRGALRLPSAVLRASPNPQFSTALCGYKKRRFWFGRPFCTRKKGIVVVNVRPVCELAVDLEGSAGADFPGKGSSALQAMF